MKPEKNQLRYTDAPLEDQDLGHESDTTACSEGLLQAVKSPRRRHSTRSESIITWIRWGAIITLQSLILIVLLRPSRSSPRLATDDVETGDDINGLFQTTSHVITPFTPQPDLFIPNMTTLSNRLDIQRNWDALMPMGSGSVAIPDYHKHPLLGEPISDDAARSGPLYEASWAHSLHCLYYVLDSYHALVVDGPTGQENTHHAGHCFEYIRNSILCSADMTLEGAVSAITAAGVGQKHVCRDRDEALEWIHARRVDSVQSIVGS